MKKSELKQFIISKITKTFNESKKKDCNCGCNTCETKSTLMLNESLAPRDILSEGLKHHMDANKPLTEHLYRAGSDSYFNLWAEARSLYSRNILEITHEDDLAVLTETDLGHYGVFEGKKVPLDFPMLDEQGVDTAWEDEEGNKVTLQDILDMTKNVPQKDYPTKKLAKVVLNWDDNPEEVERIDQVEISKQYPILIMVDEAGKIQWILDGNHRAQKALRSKAETIPAKLIKPSMLDAKAKKVLLGVVDLSEAKKLTYNDLEKSLEEVTRYSGFNRNPEDPDSEPFKPTKSVSEFTEDLRALFGKFKGDLKNPEFIKGVAQVMVNWKPLLRSQLDEAKKKKAKKNNKKLNKPMRDSSGGKAYKVYVKDPKTGNIKTVRFGSGGLKAKINNKEARNAFAARHKCSTKKDKTKAGYWSCRLPRYAKLLGLKSSFSGFW